MKIPKPLILILSELKPFRPTLSLIALAGIGMSIGTAWTSQLTEPIFQSFEDQNQERLLQSAVLVLLLTIVVNICRFFHLYLMDCVSDQVVVGLQKKIQSRILEKNASEIDAFSTGSGGIISRSFQDISIIQNGLRMVADFFREPLLLVLLLGILFWRDWVMTMMLLMLGPLFSLTLRQLAKSLRKYSHLSQNKMEGLTSTVKESLDGIRTIHSYNLQDRMRLIFSEIADRYLHDRYKIHARNQISSPIAETLATALLLAMCIYQGNQISKGLSSSAEFVAYLSAVLWLQKPLRKLQESYVRIQQVLVSLDRVFEIVEDPTPQIQKQEENTTRPFPKDFESIEFVDIGLKYGDHTVLSELNLKVKKGQTVAIVGPSGSGKSSLMSLLLRFVDPSQGQILIDGVDHREFLLADLRQNLALVSQDVFLFRGTVFENIALGVRDQSQLAKPDLEQIVYEASQRANSHDFILNLPNQYQSEVGERGQLLSGGEKQRVAIARAIAKASPILILDEATSALDSQSELEVQKGLNELVKGRTTFVIAHRLHTVQRADQIVVLDRGRVAQLGTHEELMQDQRGPYFKLVQMAQFLA